MILDNWNMKTNQWLRECIYKRVTPEGQKPGFARSNTLCLGPKSPMLTTAAAR
jgi:hypothetical protein